MRIILREIILVSIKVDLDLKYSCKFLFYFIIDAVIKSIRFVGLETQSQPEAEILISQIRLIINLIMMLGKHLKNLQKICYKKYHLNYD